MMRIRGLFLIFCALILLNCQPANNGNQKNLINNGKLDLRNHDFSKHKIIQLKGNWKFTFNTEENGYSSANYNDRHWDTFRIPGAWNRKTKTSKGFGWFRLEILLNSPDSLGIYIQKTNSAYTLYANKKKIISNGVAANTVEETVPEWQPKTGITPVSDRIVLAWKVSNFHINSGGPIMAPCLGKINDVNAYYLDRVIQFVIIIGVVIVVICYNLLLWFFRKTDKSTLYFALFCICGFINYLTSSHLLKNYLPGFNLFFLFIKLDYISFLCGNTFLVLFIKHMFPVEFNSKLITGLCIYSGAISCIILAVPLSWVEYLGVANYIVFILIVVKIFYGLIKAYKLRKKDSGFLLVGYIVFCFLAGISLFTSIFSFNFKFSYKIPAYVLLALQSITIIRRYTRAFNLSEHLSMNLQIEVDRKTRDLEEKNRELKKMNEEKVNYLVNLAHETKTPLTLLLNYVKSYEQKYGTNSELEIIQQNLDTLNRDMIHLLDTEKLNRGEIIYKNMKVINLSHYLSQKCILFSESARFSQIHFSSEIPQDIYIKEDPQAMDRIINNLLDNAIKYTPPGGQVFLKLYLADRRVHIIIKDSGMGIPEEKQNEIFNPYFQLSHNKDNTQGLGMGLYIVRSIIENMGGQLILESEKGRGSQFEIIIDACFSEPGEKVGLDVETDIHTKKKIDLSFVESEYDSTLSTIFIVEDNKQLLHYLVDFFKKAYNVYYAFDGAMAIKKIKSMPRPDLIVADVMMDRMDGFTFFKKLQEDKEFSDIILVFMTARNNPRDRFTGLSLGAVDYIGKPFLAEDLGLKVNSLLENRKNHKLYQVNRIEKKMSELLHNELDLDSRNINLEEQFNHWKISLREEEIIKRILAGYENKEIASELIISVHTVNSHLKNIFKKCKVKNRVELAHLFQKN